MQKRTKMSGKMKSLIILMLLFMFSYSLLGNGIDYLVSQTGTQFIAKNKKDGSTVRKEDKAGLLLNLLLENLKESGGSIEILSGIYKISNPLEVPSHVSISGSGASTVLLSDQATGLEAIFISDSTTKVTIKNLMISSENADNNSSAIIFDHCGDCQVKDVSISGMGSYGIWFRDRTFLSEVRGCKISNSGKSGIFFQGLRNKSRAGDFLPNLITNCIIYGGKNGITLENSLVTNIISNEVHMTEGPGFHIKDHSNSTLISGCRTFQIQNDAVKVENSHELNVSSNIFCWHDGNGILLDNVIWGTVNGNNFIDNGHINFFNKDEAFTYWVNAPDSINILDSLKCGIYATSGTRGLTFSGNAIFNWGSNVPLKHGVYEDSLCHENIILGNHINYSKGQGILSEGQKSQVGMNISSEKKPYLGKIESVNQRYHRYDPRKIPTFIEETLAPIRK